MSARVSIRVAGGPDRRDATPLAVKSASTPEEISRLAAEGERLQQIAHPGVVSYVDYRQEGDRAELHTVYAGESLERWHGTLEQAAGLVAALASSLADLHGAGVVHGRIARSHVLRGQQGRPVLCGLSTPPADADRATDVAAIGRLLEELLLGVAGTTTRPGSLLGWRDLLRSKTTRRALERVASHATDPLSTRRPSARALAEAILDAVPGAQLPTPDPARSTAAIAQAISGARLQNEGPEVAGADLFERAFVDQHDTGEEEIFIDRPWQDTGPGHIVMQVAKGRALLGVVIVAGVAALVAGRLLLTGAPDGPPQQDLPGANGSPEDVAPDCPKGAEEGVRPPPNETEVTTWADVDGDGCVEPILVTEDGVVEVGDERWGVGEPGDKVTLGDWDCDGSATPAVYRQSTGDVFVFDTWADRGRPLEVEPVGRVPGGVSLGSSRPGCDVPVVELPSGGRRSVEVTP